MNFNEYGLGLDAFAHSPIEDKFTSEIQKTNLEKARGGVYQNTPENKKLGRVGQKYGGKKVEDRGYTVDESKIFTSAQEQDAKNYIARLKDRRNNLVKKENSGDKSVSKKIDEVEAEINKHENILKEHQIHSTRKELNKQVTQQTVEHKTDLKEGDSVRVAGGKLGRVIEIRGNSIRTSETGQDYVHITKLFRESGDAVIQASKSNKDWTMPSLAHLDREDRQDIKEVKDIYDKGDLVDAMRYALSLDTIVREVIPKDIWNEMKQAYDSEQKNKLKKAYDTLNNINLEKADISKEHLKEMIKEHEQLVDVLDSPSHKDDKKESKKQKKELKEYKKDLKKAFAILDINDVK